MLVVHVINKHIYVAEEGGQMQAKDIYQLIDLLTRYTGKILSDVVR